MQPQILRVDNIKESIKSCGIRFYIDRLLQDSIGDYFYIDYVESETPFQSQRVSMEYATEVIDSFGVDITMYYQYSICPIPRKLAYFIIDFIKTQDQIRCAGLTDYGAGQHGGKESILRFIDRGYVDITKDSKVVRVEDLG